MVAHAPQRVTLVRACCLAATVGIEVRQSETLYIFRYRSLFVGSPADKKYASPQVVHVLKQAGAL